MSEYRAPSILHSPTNLPGGYGADANPFADTSRTANPFSLDNSSAFSLDGMGNPASSSNPTNAAGVNIQAYVSDHDKRAAELERKQRELEQRERDLAQREQDIAQYKSNWPPCE
jgi:hypothetical protein